MKICLINNLYEPYMRGGAEMIVLRIARGLKEGGHQVFVVTTARAEKKEGDVYYLKSFFQAIEKIPFVLRFFYHVWDSFNFINYFKVKKILERERPSMVMTHALKGIGFLLPLLFRKLKIKHVHTLHDIQLLHPSGLLMYKKETRVNTPHAKAYQLINKFLFGSPELIISPSSWLMEMHRSRGFFNNSKKAILPNYISRLPFYEESQKDDKFTFLSAGQIEEHKGIPFLVKAFLSLLEKGFLKNSELLIIGRGSKEEEIKRMASGHEQIKILGRLANEEVKEIMSRSDCLVVPSFCYENSPTIIYEAVAAGLPVIASRIGGIPELINKGRGFLFEPGNLDELVSGLKFVAGNPKELKAVREKQREFKNFDYIKELMILVAQKEDNVIK